MSILSRVKSYYWSQGFGAAELDDGSHLHLWMPEWNEASVPIVHSHSYLFNSKMLVGDMIAGEFRKEPNPDGDWVFFIKEPEPIDLIFVETIHAKQGDTYEFGGPDRFHFIPHNRNPVMTHFIVIPDSCNQEGAGFALRKEDVDRKYTTTTPPTKEEIEEKYNLFFKK